MCVLQRGIVMCERRCRHRLIADEQLVRFVTSSGKQKRPRFSDLFKNISRGYSTSRFLFVVSIDTHQLAFSKFKLKINSQVGTP